MLRLVPKLQAYMQRSTNELAFVLWHKRLNHVFRHLDGTGSGRLGETGLEFFHTAMSAEFPDHSKQVKQNVFNGVDYQIAVLKGKAKRSMLSSVLKGCEVGDASGSFSTLVQDFITSPEGKSAYKCCKEVIECMKEACAIVGRAVGRLTPNVCVLVLMPLLTTQLLMQPQDDMVKLQGCISWTTSER